MVTVASCRSPSSVSCHQSHLRVGTSDDDNDDDDDDDDDDDVWSARKQLRKLILYLLNRNVTSFWHK